MSKDTPPSNPVRPPTPCWARWSLLFNVAGLALLLQASIPSITQLNLSRYPLPPPRSARHECRAPLPSFLETDAPSGAEEPLQEAFDQLNAALQHDFDKGIMDSLSVAIVASDGALYEGFWGKRRANESDDIPVDRHSIYRLASISKLFTALETLILRDRGALKLDDPISSVCPQFRYNKYYAPITFRNLMSHMSGIGRDLPPGDAQGHWPKSLTGRGPPGYNGLEFPSHQQVFDGIARSHPIVAPYAYPVYSNTGYSLLGIANVAANIIANGPSAPSTHAELVKKDIFEPLGFNGTSFLVAKDVIDNVVVPSLNPWEIDQDFKDATNPAGGQMSSLSDLTKLMQVLINPRRPESILSPFTVREWMRPMHTWFDDYSNVGALWEIYTSTDSYGRRQNLYQKLGELAGHHSAFTLNPINSYGVIVLQSGPTSETIRLTKLIMSHVQTAFDHLLEGVTHRSLVGTWRSTDRVASLTIEIDHGSIYVSKYIINGTDVLRAMQGDHPSALTRLPLWPTVDNEYRLVVPTPNEGCFYSWAMLDMYGYIDGVSTNVIVSETRDSGERVLFLPSIKTKLQR